MSKNDESNMSSALDPVTATEKHCVDEYLQGKGEAGIDRVCLSDAIPEFTLCVDVTEGGAVVTYQLDPQYLINRIKENVPVKDQVAVLRRYLLHVSQRKAGFESKAAQGRPSWNYFDDLLEKSGLIRREGDLYVFILGVMKGGADA